MNPEELLKRVALYVSNGMPPDEANRYVAQESNGRFATIQALTESMAPPAKPKPAGKRASDFVTGLGQNAVQGATLQFGDELAGVMSSALSNPLAALSAASSMGSNPSAAAGALAGSGAPGQYEKARDEYRASQEQFLAEHPYLGATAQTAGGLGGLLAAGLIGGPVAAAGYLPGLVKSMGVAGAYGLGAGAGAAPEMKDVPAYAGSGATNAEILTGVLGTTIPTGAWVASKGKGLWDLLRGSPEALQRIAERRVGTALSNDQATGSGLPILDKMQEMKLSGVVPADAGGESASLLRQSANKDPGLQLPLKQLVRDRQAQRAPNMAAALERTRGMTQSEARAGEQAAAEATSALGPKFNAINKEVLPPNSPAASAINEMRSWMKQQADPMNSPVMQQINAQRAAAGLPPIQPAVGAGEAIAVERPMYAPRIGRIVDRAIRNVGDGPLTVGKARVILNTLKDAQQASLDGPAKDRSLWPILKEQIARLESAVEETSPNFKALNRAYYQQKLAEEAFQAGRETRAVADPIAAMQARADVIAKGPPETAQRLAQGSTADWTDFLRASSQRNPGRTFTQLADVASARRDLAGEFDPRRALWKSDFPSQQAVNQMDEAVALADRMAQTEGAMTGNSTTAAQLEGAAGEAGSFQLARDLVRGGNPKWGFARGMAHLMDMIRQPQTKALAGKVGEILKQPMTPAVRESLWKMMQMEFERQQQAQMLGGLQLQRAMATGALAGSPK